MRTIRKGSITIWLSLVLCVILALIFACLQSARLSAARGCVSVCVDESLFSEFARYDRILYEKYGLLAVDGGFGTGEPDIAAVAKEIEEAGKTLLSTQGDLFRIGYRETDITGYVLATDSGAAPLKKQISELMTVKLGADGINRLRSMVDTYAPVMEQQEQEGTADPENIREIYEQQKAQAQARAAEEAARSAESTGSEETENVGTGPSGPVEVPEDFKNPLDNIEAILKMGIYNTILPDPAAVSGMAVDRSSLIQSREPAEGLGILPEEEDGTASHLLTAAYIRDFFPNFRTVSETESPGIRYQAEFAIAGKEKDADNLKSVLNRLLLIRMGLNYLYLAAMAPEKKAEAEGCALIIAAILMAPEATEVITQIVLMAWALGESMMDLKTLLAGGREPLIKDESTWQLSLEALASFSPETPPQSRTGLSYEDHLLVLLAMKSDRDLTRALLDLLEYNRRRIGNDPDFAIDACFTAIETEMLFTIDGKEYSITRGYGYDMG